MNQSKDSIIGQDSLLKFFNKLAVIGDRRSLGGSFIFLGPSGAGKKTLANILIGKLLCQAQPMQRPCGQCAACVQLQAGVNGNVFWLSLADDQKNIAVEDIRGLLHALGLSSLGQGYRAAVIDRAEKLSTQAANALLKTLEEPNKKTLIILLATSTADLPKTVLSRSQIFNLRPLDPGKIYDWLVEGDCKRSHAKTLAALSLGWPGLAVKFSDTATLNRHLAVAEAFLSMLNQGVLERQTALDDLLAKEDAAMDILTVWQTVCRDLLLWKLAFNGWLRYGGLLNQFQDKLPMSLKQIIAWYKLLVQAKDYAAANVNQRAVLDNVIINL